jgi:hypothetical protein
MNPPTCGLDSCVAGRQVLTELTKPAEDQLAFVFGTLIIAIAGLSLLNVSGCWERVVVGAIILIAVLTDLLRSRDVSSPKSAVDGKRR